MAIFYDLKSIMGDSPEQARENLHNLKTHYQFWYDGGSLFTELEEMIRHATPDDWIPGDSQASPARWHTRLKAILDKRSARVNTHHQPLVEVFNGKGSRIQRAGNLLPERYLPVKQALNKQLKHKRSLASKLVDYHYTMHSADSDVKVFHLALFLDWSSTEKLRRTKPRQDHCRYHLKQQLKAVSALLNGLRHHKGLSKMVGYFWVVMQDIRGKPYIRLHLYVKKDNYTGEMLRSIIQRWLSITGNDGAASHRHDALLKPPYFRLESDLHPFTLEEDMLHANLLNKKLNATTGPAAMTTEYHLEALAKRVMFWPECRSYYCSHADAKNQ